MIIELADGADECLADYTRLTDVALRRRLETRRGLYMAESSKVITRAVAAGHAPRSFLMAPRHLDEMRPVIASATGCAGRDDGGDVPVFVAPEEVLESITGFHLHRGALAAMNRPELVGVPELLSAARGGSGARRVAILEDLVDHTNVGAAFRSAAALGIDAVLVTPRCADPLYRRSVRVSMGTVFQVPWTRIERWPCRRTRWRWTSSRPHRSVRTRARRSPSSWGRKAMGCPTGPSLRPTRWCAFRWPGQLTPSTWLLRRPWHSGRCGCRDPALSCHWLSAGGDGQQRVGAGSVSLRTRPRRRISGRSGRRCHVRLRPRAR